MEIFSTLEGFSVPHHTTIRQWIIRFGCYHLQIPLEHANDWIFIGDLTISTGKLKCLAILGMRMSNSQDDLTLSHKDVEVLGLYPIEKSTGEFCDEAFENSSKRIGGNFLAGILDQGSDIKKGARLFQEKHPSLKVIHDIAHKLSNVVEHELKNDTQWSEYIQQLNLTRRQVFQTELAAIMPKKQREKARFMDIGRLLYWPKQVRKSKADGHLNDISEERYEKYLGWVEESFIDALREWGFMEGAVTMIKEIVRMYGLSMDVYMYIRMFFEEACIKGERIQKFILKALNAVWEEVIKLDEGQTLICSTEVIESVFGKYKAINEGLHGITSNILGICTFVGKEKNVVEIKKAMEKCSVKMAVEFVREKFGQTLSSLRKKYFPSIKRTKFDIVKR